MKAVVQDVYGSADVLELRDVDKPTVGERDVLVRVRAAGVDPSGGEGGGPWLAGLQRNIGAGLLTPFMKQRLVGLFSRASGADLEHLRELVEAGKVTPVIDRVFGLAHVPEAVRYLQHGQTRGGKVVIAVPGGSRA